MKYLAILVGSVSLAMCTYSIAQGSGEENSAAWDGARPNIIVIMADDLGWGDVSINGADLIETPNIDRIGREGIQLTSFYAGANVCTPSRAALLTGRYPVRSGMQHIIFPHSQGGLPQDEVTIPEVLKTAGYATGMVGKWHLGHQDEHWPTEHGFDEFFGVAYSNDMQPFDLYEQKTIIQAPADQSELTNRYAEASADFIARYAEAETPFFLYVAETFPHIPLFAPEDAENQSEAGLYGDVVQHLDTGVGQILDALDAAGVADNTLIIFTSDNGPWFEGDSGPHRNRKGGTYEGGYLVPMLARWPDKIAPGLETNAMAMSIDFLPTFARLAGAELPGELVLDGKDISDLMMGGTQSPHEVLFFYNGNDIAAARDERYRLVLNDYYKTFYVPFEQFGAALLFDLETDPQERFDFSRDNEQVVETLLGHVEAMREDTADLIIEPDPVFLASDDPTPRGPQLTDGD